MTRNENTESHQRMAAEQELKVAEKARTPRKTESQKKTPPDNKAKGKLGSLLNDATFVKGNDQCKLQCRDCWVSALFVCQT